MLDETERLLLCKPTRNDAASLHACLGDPVATRFASTSPSLEATRERIAVHEAARRCRGYAPWVLRDKANMEIIGWGGLYADPFKVGLTLELVCHIRISSRRKGLAAELVMHCISRARQDGLARQIQALVHQQNTPARRLLEFGGFGYREYDTALDRIRYEYCVRADAQNANFMPADSA